MNALDLKNADCLHRLIASGGRGSRLVFRCGRCACTGSRDQSIRYKPGELPAFTDVCPNCGSNDVDVIDVGASTAVQDTIERDRAVRSFKNHRAA